VQWAISRWKSACIDPQQAQAAASSPNEAAAARTYAAYSRQLNAYNAVDFDDLLWLPLQLWQRDEASLERWQGYIRYLLVDEYQDTNTCQYQLVKALIGGRGALTVVGDDDQSIYAWRGAQPDSLRLLQGDFPRVKSINTSDSFCNHLIMQELIFINSK
jgi:ATP-dependent DNA helicase Rep